MRGCTNIPLQHSRWVFNTETRTKEVERQANKGFLEEVCWGLACVGVWGAGEGNGLGSGGVVLGRGGVRFNRLYCMKHMPALPLLRMRLSAQARGCQCPAAPA